MNAIEIFEASKAQCNLVNSGDWTAKRGIDVVPFSQLPLSIFGLLSSNLCVSQLVAITEANTAVANNCIQCETLCGNELEKVIHHLRPNKDGTYSAVIELYDLFTDPNPFTLQICR